MPFELSPIVQAKIEEILAEYPGNKNAEIALRFELSQVVMNWLLDFEHRDKVQTAKKLLDQERLKAVE